MPDSLNVEPVDGEQHDSGDTPLLKSEKLKTTT